FGEDIAAMMSLIDNALAMNPSFARGWFLSGHLRIMAGQPDAAIGHVQTSLRLSPRERMCSHWYIIGVAHFFNRQFQDAAAKLLMAIQEFPTAPVAYRFLASTYAHMGQLDKAQAIVRELRAITPIVLPNASYLRNAEQRELFLSGLRLAMDEAGADK